MAKKIELNFNNTDTQRLKLYLEKIYEGQTVPDLSDDNKIISAFSTYLKNMIKSKLQAIELKKQKTMQLQVLQ